MSVWTKQVDSAGTPHNYLPHVAGYLGRILLNMFVSIIENRNEYIKHNNIR